MALQMTRPHKHPKTGVYYFRQRVPTDLRPILGNKTVSKSLGTKDPDRAKVLIAAAIQKQALIWEQYRKAPEPLPHAKIVALSGLLYRDIMEMMELEPGEASIWDAVLALLDRVSAKEGGLEKWYGETADKFLLEQGMVTDAYSRQRLLKELDRALRQAAEQQRKRAEGDYAPDPNAARFPPLSVGAVAPADSAGGGPTIRGLFALWERDHLAEGKSARTVGDFRQKLESLISFLGHDDARRVTPENIADWCDDLRHDNDLAARSLHDAGDSLHGS